MDSNSQVAPSSPFETDIKEDTPGSDLGRNKLLPECSCGDSFEISSPDTKCADGGMQQLPATCFTNSEATVLPQNHWSTPFEALTPPAPPSNRCKPCSVMNDTSDTGVVNQCEDAIQKFIQPDTNIVSITKPDQIKGSMGVNDDCQPCLVPSLQSIPAASDVQEHANDIPQKGGKSNNIERAENCSSKATPPANIQNAQEYCAVAAEISRVHPFTQEGQDNGSQLQTSTCSNYVPQAQAPANQMVRCQHDGKEGRQAQQAEQSLENVPRAEITEQLCSSFVESALVELEAGFSNKNAEEVISNCLSSKLISSSGSGSLCNAIPHKLISDGQGQLMHLRNENSDLQHADFWKSDMERIMQASIRKDEEFEKVSCRRTELGAPDLPFVDHQNTTE